MNTDRPPAGTAARGMPLFRLGFRPFYLVAAIYGAVVMPLWWLVFTGELRLPAGLSPVWWHAHEMVFGFVAAVVVGFLLTAGKAWTGLPTPRGPALAALAGLWVLARLAALWAPYGYFLVLDLALLPVVALVFARVLLRAGNRRNAPVAAVLFVLAGANLMFHLGAAGLVPLDPMKGVHAAIAAVIVLETIIGGRVVPSFTANATPGLVIRQVRGRDESVLVTTVIGLALWLADAGIVAAAALGLAAALQLWRAAAWKPQVTLDRPILWILHLSYAWVPLGLALLAAAAMDRAPASLGIHALMVGATGGLIIGMITRTARGHTGRELRASGMEVSGYVLMLGAAVVRVLLPLLAPGATMASYVISGAMWALSLALYLLQFAPWLVAARADGADG